MNIIIEESSNNAQIPQDTMWGSISSIVVTTPQKKSVHFSEDSFAIDMPPLQQISKDERKNQWYKTKDYEIFHKNNNRTAKQVRTDRRNRQPSTVESRGLENMLTVRANLDVRARRAAQLQAVLTEQKRQRYNGIYDPNKLRKVCRVATRPSRLLAHALAHADAKDVHHVEETIFGNNYNTDVDKSPRKPMKTIDPFTVTYHREPKRLDIFIDHQMKRIVLT